MAITAFTGPPGSGKSHALVKDVMLPALKVGRRVLTNIDGVDPDAIRAYFASHLEDVTQLGAVVLFHGDDALKPGFWPDEATPDSGTFVKAGDLVIFDEWALYFPKRGKWPAGCNAQAFMRWHRHLTAPDGTATDLAIGTQLATDIHPDVRGLVVKSYKFRKLTALGAEGSYSWLLFEGHLQPKGEHYRAGTGKYDKEVFPLYASSAAAKEGKHVELRTNAKESVWNSWQAWATIAAIPVLLMGGGWGIWRAWNGVNADPPVPPASPSAAVGAASAAPPRGAYPVAAPPDAPSGWRIIGYIAADYDRRVIVQTDGGAIRFVRPDGFEFDKGRPVSGVVDGRRVYASDGLATAPAASSGIATGLFPQ